MQVEWLTTTTVLASLRDYHNRAAWDDFVSRFHLPIVRFARSLGLGDVDAQDVAQETLIAFAEAYRAGQYDRSKGRLSKWLFGIAYRQALGQRRRGARQTARQGGDPGTGFWATVPDEATATHSWDREWEQALLEACLRQVRHEVEPVTLRAFELVIQHARSPAEAAAELGVSIKLVYNAKHRILKRIRELRAALDDSVGPPAAAMG